MPFSIPRQIAQQQPVVRAPVAPRQPVVQGPLQTAPASGVMHNIRALVQEAIVEILNSRSELNPSQSSLATNAIDDPVVQEGSAPGLAAGSALVGAGDPGAAASVDAAPTGLATDPLTKKGAEIMRAMKDKYGEEKGERVFYASKNKGTISGVDSVYGVDMSPDEMSQLGELLKKFFGEEAKEPEHDDQGQDQLGTPPAEVSLDPKAGDDLAYHGTRGAALQSIRDNGILAHPSMHYHPERFYKGERGNSVYLATDPETALQWAIDAVASPTDASVLAVEVPHDRLVPDEEAAGTNAERFPSDIPPEWIRAVYPVLPNGQLGEPYPLVPNQTAASGVDPSEAGMQGTCKRFVGLVHQKVGGAGEQPTRPVSATPTPPPGGHDAAPASTASASAAAPAVSPPPAQDDPVDSRFELLPGRLQMMDKLTGKVILLGDILRKLSTDEPALDVTRFERMRRALTGDGDPKPEPEAPDWLADQRDYGGPDWLVDQRETAADEEEPDDAPSWEQIRAAIGKKDADDPDALASWIARKLNPGCPSTGIPAAMDAVPAIAMDWHGCVNLYEHGRPTPAMAFDRGTVREYSPDGHLHIKTSNIAMARVDPYKGAEIPGADELGLDPGRTYRLYRPPEELSKPETVESFKGKPILISHKPVSADDHPQDLVVGGVGSNVVWRAPFITADLTFWPRSAIDGIESGTQKQLSPAYSYTPVMKSGVSPDGQRYDGIMTQIRANHVSLVREGRQGENVVVADSAEEHLWAAIEGALG